MTVVLENFEGPIDLLFHLVQQSEIDIYEVRLQVITEQFMTIITKNPPAIDKSSEFLATAAALLWLKSKTLLPPQEQAKEEEEAEEDPHLEIIQHLVEYCRIKEAAQLLSTREQQQQGYYSRGLSGSHEVKKPMGIEHLTLDDLAGLFKSIASRASSQPRLLEAETWKLADKIEDLRADLQRLKKIQFSQLFSYEKCRLELIVTFLAVLELMKLGEVGVIKDLAIEEHFVISKLVH